MEVNFFVDMDGVLANVSNDEMIKFMYDEYFFLSLPPFKNMVNLVKHLIKNNHTVYILSTVMDTPFCKLEKEIWAKKLIPELNIDNILFVPYGTTKANFVINNDVNIDEYVNVLLDDFTKNLNEWILPNAIPIKVLNGTNNSKGTWLAKGGFHIDSSSCEIYNYKKISNFVKQQHDTQ